MEHVDHILIVDDDREIRELVGNYLKKNGLRVSLAADGRQMRAFLEGNTVDLIVHHRLPIETAETAKAHRG